MRAIDSRLSISNGKSMDHKSWHTPSAHPRGFSRVRIIFLAPYLKISQIPGTPGGAPLGVQRGVSHSL